MSLRRKAYGSRPSNLDNEQEVLVWRNGKYLGLYKVKDFNWDLWCEYQTR